VEYGFLYGFFFKESSSHFISINPQGVPALQCNHPDWAGTLIEQ
jgi:hypothetical protein